MKYFANGGFYDSDVHTTIPDGAVEISDELYQSLMESQAVGKRITSGEDGLPGSRWIRTRLLRSFWPRFWKPNGCATGC